MEHGCGNFGKNCRPRGFVDRGLDLALGLARLAVTSIEIKVKIKADNRPHGLLYLRCVGTRRYDAEDDKEKVESGRPLRDRSMVMVRRGR